MRRLLVPALMLAACTMLSAHDFWPASSAPANARATVTANVGEVFPKATNFTQPDRVDQWRVRPGSRLVKTVHMTRVTDTPGVSWESFWVTLAFQTASR